MRVSAYHLPYTEAFAALSAGLKAYLDNEDKENWHFVESLLQAGEEKLFRFVAIRQATSCRKQQRVQHMACLNVFCEVANHKVNVGSSLTCVNPVSESVTTFSSIGAVTSELFAQYQKFCETMFEIGVIHFPNEYNPLDKSQ